MTLEERYALSCYETLSRLQDDKDIWLVRNNEDGNLYVKKIIALYNKEVYLRLQNMHLNNIPRIIMCVEDGALLIVIEEYIHGNSLQKQLDMQGAFSQEDVIKLMLHLCDILEPLHNCEPPIIHRDIKPSNIMISNDGVVKLIDFNAAKEFHAEQNEDTRLMGTRHFAAPEQYGFGQSDQRTDIYAMGITMFYLLTGTFPEENNMPGELGEIIRKCICLEKQDRYQSVERLKEDMLHIQRHLRKKNDSSEKQNIQKHSMYARTQHDIHRYLPLGFRSGMLWKMLLAVCGYVFIFWFCLTLDIKDSTGQLLTAYPLWANRIAVLVMVLFSVCLMGNYMGVRKQLPFMQKNRIVDIILTGIYLLIFYLLVFILLIIAGGVE